MARQQEQEKLKAAAIDESWESFLQRLGITNWDYILIGDGSGSTYEYPCGWGCLMVQRDPLLRKTWAGCINNGTVNVAEIMAYVAPLNWIASTAPGEPGHVKTIHILTDSQYVRDVGSGKYGKTPKKNAILWTGIYALERFGLQLIWHWIGRETLHANIYADHVSKLARERIKSYDIQADALLATGVSSTYDING